MIKLVIDMLRNNRPFRFILSMATVLLLSFALPYWSGLGTAIYGAALGYRA